MKNKFSSPELKIIGIKRARLKEWLKLGYIRPSVQEADGRGTKHIFNRDDIYTLFLFEELITQGLHRKFAGEIVKQFFYDLSRFSQAIEGGTPYFVISRVAEPGKKSSMHGQFLMEIPNSLPPSFCFQWAFNLINIKERVDAVIGG